MDYKLWAKLAVTMLAAAGVIGLLAYGFTRDARYIQSPLIARAAPPFTLTLFDGGTLRLEELRGKRVVLNFWASWCVPCRAEAGVLEAAWQRYKDQDVAVIGINIQDKEEDARAFINDFALTYSNGPDKDGKIAIDYGVWGIPETFFLDPKGTITYKHTGELTEPIIEKKLAEALKSIVSTEGKGKYLPVR